MALQNLLVFTVLLLSLGHSSSSQASNHSKSMVHCKKENLIFLINKEIQNGAVAKSYMTNSFLIFGEIFAHFLIY
jgi:hypothetical protein